MVKNTVAKHYYRCVDRWSDGVTKIRYFQYDVDTNFDDVKSLIHTINLKHQDNELKHKIVSIDPVSDDADKALQMCDYDYGESFDLLHRVLDQVEAGHYNEHIIKRLREIVEIEYMYDDKHREKIFTMLSDVPTRDICENVEMWMIDAIDLFGDMRLHQCETRREIYKQIEKEFAEKGAKG